MTSADVLGVLAEATLSMSVAIVLVLVVRRPLRRWVGAAAGYAAWGVVPVAAMAVLLPAMAAPVLPAAAVGEALAVGAIASAGSATAGAIPWVVAAWSCGVFAMAMRLAMQQRAFLRSLGDLRARRDGTFQSTVVAGLPAVIGLLQPRTELPADFDQRYTVEQQVLLRTHEREHVARGDLWANALVAMLRCLSWFNPLVHAAARSFRHDQELACDQRVLAAMPGARRAYGEAMFNTQLAAQPLPLGCHWGFGHPLKERIAMLKQPLPTRRRWLAGAALVTTMTALTGVAAWAAQPPAGAAPAASPAAAPEAPASTSMQPPKYPAAAVEQKISGRVLLLIDIDASGNPTAIEVEKAEPAGVFEEQAVAAAWNWKFEPEIKGGKAVASRVRVPVDFKIDPPAVPASAEGA